MRFRSCSLIDSVNPSSSETPFYAFVYIPLMDIDVVKDVRRQLRQALKDPEKKPMAERILKRLETASRTATVNPRAFQSRARRFGVDGHDLGCMCDGCIGFWGEVK